MGKYLPITCGFIAVCIHVTDYLPLRMMEAYRILIYLNVQETDADNMKVIIKNMVSLRCKMVVKSELDKLRIEYTSIELGNVELKENLSVIRREQLKNILSVSGLELMDDKKDILVEKIKNVIIEMVHYSEELPLMNFSNYLSSKLQLDYAYLSSVFSKAIGITIESYIILHKIERVKELLIYDELTLKEIACKLNYSSIAHVSNQFKKVTGYTPSFFKAMKQQNRIFLENL